MKTLFFWVAALAASSHQAAHAEQLATLEHASPLDSDPSADRVGVTATTIAPRQGELVVSNDEALLFAASFGVSDSVSINAGYAPLWVLPNESGQMTTLGARWVIDQRGSFRTAIGARAIDLRGTVDDFTLAEVGGLASLCLSSDCAALVTVGASAIVLRDRRREDGADSLPALWLSTSLQVPVTTNAKLLAELVAVPRFDKKLGIGSALAGARIHTGRWSIDAGVIGVVDLPNRASAQIEPVPWLRATLRIR